MTSAYPFPTDSASHPLKRLAGKGDLEAIAVLMHQALAHKAIQVEVARTDQTLHLNLTADPLPEERIAVMLVCREVLQWLPIDSDLSWETITLDGKASDATEVGWQYEVAIAPSPFLPTVAQAASGVLWAVDSVAVPAALSPVQPIEAPGWKAIAAGLFLAMLVLASGQVTFLLSPLITLVHELGHTCLSWIFGYPAIPAFDFMNGGGVTMHSAERVSLIVCLIYAALGYLFYRYWNNHLTARILLATSLSYTLWAFTPVHEMLTVAMGHGFELIFAGLFLYRAVSGSGCQYSIERPLYAMLSCYLVAYDLRFTFGLLFDADARYLYLQGKGGVLDNDLVRLANDYFHNNLSVVATLLLICTLLTPAIALLFYYYRPLTHRMIYRLFFVRYQA